MEDIKEFKYWIGAVGIGSILTYLYDKWMRDEQEKVNQILSQRKWKIEDMFKDAEETLKGLKKDGHRDFDTTIEMYRR